MFAPFKIKKETIDSICDGYQYDTSNITRILKTNINVETIKKHFIDGSKLQEEWFPTKCYDSQFQVFISHAHKDSDTVNSLAGFLYSEYGLYSFIDSVYWGYVDELLLDMNKYYSAVNRNGVEVYDYSTCNFIAANVHIMLSNALMRMMDACECLIFVDSDYSMKYRKNQTTTPSPWIFEEIGFSQCLRINIPERYKSKITVNLNESHDQSEIQMFTVDKGPRTANIDYHINLKDFKEFSTIDLIDFCGNLKGTDLLDKWYEKYGVQKVFRKIIE